MYEKKANISGDAPRTMCAWLRNADVGSIKYPIGYGGCANNQFFSLAVGPSNQLGLATYGTFYWTGQSPAEDAWFHHCVACEYLASLSRARARSS